jgi:uncharacterized protein (TIGR02271 family)
MKLQEIIMANTLVGVYERFSDAQSVYNELLSCGFDRSDLQLSPSDESSDARQASLNMSSTTGGDTADHSFGAGVRRFFHDLFSGSDEYQEHADVYAEAVRRGHYLITVHADNDEERVQATQVMNRFNPVDIDERAAGWRSRGWSQYDETAPALSDSEIADERRYYATGSAATMGGMSAATRTADATIADTSRADTTADNTYSTRSTRDTLAGADTVRTDADMSQRDITAAYEPSKTDTTATTAPSFMADRTTSESATSRLSDTDTDLTRRQATTADLSSDSRTIPVIQEELQVGKREVQRGGVRVYQHIKETPVDQSVRLHEERVHVERHPVDRPASEADLSGLKESSFELRETAEEAVVGKTARIVEEVVVSKEATERTEEIHDKVRRTDVEIEQLGTSGRDTSTSALASDEDFRKHFQTTYGSSSSDRFEDYEPAYRYGSTLAADERFRGHKWDESEEDVHADWDSHYGSATPWEKAKNAVRYAWEKATR